MTDRNDSQGAAIYALSLLELGTIDWLPVPGTHRLNGHACRVVLDAIRANKIPGIALKAYDGTTCWACEKCGKTRSGRGCMACLERELLSREAEVAEQLANNRAMLISFASSLGLPIPAESEPLPDFYLLKVLSSARDEAKKLRASEAERDRAVAENGRLRELLVTCRALVCSIAADDQHSYWEHAAEIVKRIDSILTPQKDA